MGLFFRKSFSSGPFRFTLSKRGISSSFGVRGARVTAGPRGTFVTLSSHGIYYRHRIDQRNREHQTRSQQQETTEQLPIDSVFHVPSAELIASDQNELVKTLNENASAYNPGILLIAAALGSVFLFGSYPLIGLALLVSGVLLGVFVLYRFKEAHTHDIHYSLDQSAASRYAEIQGAIGSLSSCSRIWVLNTRSNTSDLKRNAGAGLLITRRPATAGRLTTRGFRTSVSVLSIEANGVVLHFLPDQILLYSRGQYSSIAYGELSLTSRSTRFVETDPLPRDGLQVDTTWRYVNKSGGPDRRFNNNYRIPVLQYADITLANRAGLQVVLQASNLQKAQAFVAGILGSSASQAASRSARGEDESAHINGALAKCYELLGLTRPTTAERAAAAHRSQAALYHPDKYEHLAPEMKRLAIAKMAEINAAYELIKLDIAKQ